MNKYLVDGMMLGLALFMGWRVLDSIVWTCRWEASEAARDARRKEVLKAHYQSYLADSAWREVTSADMPPKTEDENDGLLSLACIEGVLTGTWERNGQTFVMLYDDAMAAHYFVKVLPNGPPHQRLTRERACSRTRLSAACGC
jgi:hypothetical protein